MTAPDAGRSSGAGVCVQSFADLARRISQTPARLGATRLVAIDGPTGSGKTTFAHHLAAHVRATGATVECVHTDELLDGWSDMVSFWPRLEDGVLAPVSHGQQGSHHRYDWHMRRFEESAQVVTVPQVLVIEGVTSARAVVRPRLSAGIYLTADRDLRLARVLGRDGEQVRDELLRWIADEERHFRRDATAAHVDLVVDGAPTIPHDPQREYVRLLGYA